MEILAFIGAEMAGGGILPHPLPGRIILKPIPGLGLEFILSYFCNWLRTRHLNVLYSFDKRPTTTNKSQTATKSVWRRVRNWPISLSVIGEVGPLTGSSGQLSMPAIWRRSVVFEVCQLRMWAAPDYFSCECFDGWSKHVLVEYCSSLCLVPNSVL